jgi:hypothetical protein
MPQPALSRLWRSGWGDATLVGGTGLRPAPMHGYPKVFNVEADSRQEHNMAEQHE